MPSVESRPSLRMRAGRGVDPRSIESMHGLICKEEELLKVIDMCREGVLPRVKQRLSEEERACIRAGSIFVYEEKESGISRWTDGREWSASKIRGRCLSYTEVVDKEDKDLHLLHREDCGIEEILEKGRRLFQGQAPLRREGPPGGRTPLERRRARRRQSVPKPGGLLKMATSARVGDSMYHLVAYSTKEFERSFLRSSPLWDKLFRWTLAKSIVLRASYRQKPHPAQKASAPSKLPVSVEDRSCTQCSPVSLRSSDSHLLENHPLESGELQRWVVCNEYICENQFVLNEYFLYTREGVEDNLCRLFK